jgi:hypothetical protein
LQSRPSSINIRPLSAPRFDRAVALREREETMAMTNRAIVNLLRFSVTLGLFCVAVPMRTLGGDLQPPGPPAPTMRTLDSLGFDCPTDKANNQTNLLYTYVVNVNGFDTGLTFSNTGSDPFGTVPPACPGNLCECVLNFYGSSAPMPFHTGAIAPGATYATLISTIAPGFAGYVIATCDFPYAHGFALITDVGARNLASGYLANVICSDRNSTAMGNGR